MTSPSGPNDPMLQHIFDALPSMVFVVDTDVRVQAFNAAAAELLAGNEGAVLKKPSGEALGCLNAAVNAKGCGHGPACGQCVVRNSVTAVFEGRRAVRRRTRLELSRGGETVELFALVTASPLVYEGRQLALMVIEDFSEIAELRRLIPICCVCKKVREEATTSAATCGQASNLEASELEGAEGGTADAESGGWSRLEAYFKSQWGVDFSHGYCPECYREAFGQLKAVLPKSRVA